MDAEFLHVDKGDSNQTARMRRLICVLSGHTCQKVGFLTLRLLADVCPGYGDIGIFLMLKSTHSGFILTSGNSNPLFHRVIQIHYFIE